MPSMHLIAPRDHDAVQAETAWADTDGWHQMEEAGFCYGTGLTESTSHYGGKLLVSQV
jgi:hypothetical protein